MPHLWNRIMVEIFVRVDVLVDQLPSLQCHDILLQPEEDEDETEWIRGRVPNVPLVRPSPIPTNYDDDWMAYSGASFQFLCDGHNDGHKARRRPTRRRAKGRKTGNQAKVARKRAKVAPWR